MNPCMQEWVGRDTLVGQTSSATGGSAKTNGPALQKGMARPNGASLQKRVGRRRWPPSRILPLGCGSHGDKFFYTIGQADGRAESAGEAAPRDVTVVTAVCPAVRA